MQTIETVQVIADASKHVPAGADVHVRMLFDTDGDMVRLRASLNFLASRLCPAQFIWDFQRIEVSSSSTQTATESSLIHYGTQLASTKFLEVADCKLHAASRIARPLRALPAITTADLKSYRLLGEGGQGSVSLVQYMPNGRLYALKTTPSARSTTKSLRSSSRSKLSSRNWQ